MWSFGEFRIRNFVCFKDISELAQLLWFKLLSTATRSKLAFFDACTMKGALPSQRTRPEADI